MLCMYVGIPFDHYISSLQPWAIVKFGEWYSLSCTSFRLLVPYNQRKSDPEKLEFPTPVIRIPSRFMFCRHRKPQIQSIKHGITEAPCSYRLNSMPFPTADSLINLNKLGMQEIQCVLWYVKSRPRDWHFACPTRCYWASYSYPSMKQTPLLW